MTDQAPRTDAGRRTCLRMVTRWVGNPDDPEKVREACGRPAKFTLTADQSPHVSVFVCGRHARWSPSMQTFMPVHIVPLDRRHG